MRKRISRLFTMLLLLPLMPIFGVIKVKSADEVSRKWGEVTPGRSAYYEAGAGVAGADWEKNAAAAAGAYRSAVTAPNIEAMFKGGIKRAGGTKYERKVKDVGVARFGTGVTAAIEDMKAGIAPMLETIAAVTLPARQPRGTEANWRRSIEVGMALHKKRLALRAAGV